MKEKFDFYKGILINTSDLTDSYIGFTLKMESVSKNTIFGLKMMVKRGLEKILLKFLHAERWSFLEFSENPPKKDYVIHTFNSGFSGKLHNRDHIIQA